MALRVAVERNHEREPRELTHDQVRTVFEKKVERSLGMSGSEFLERLDAGTLPEHPAVDEIRILVGGDGR